MDTPIYTPPAAPVAPHANRRRLFIIIGIVIVLMLVLGSLFLWKAGKFGGGLVPRDERLTVTVDGLPLIAAHTMNLKTGELSPLTVEGLGTAVLIDTASSEAYDYFLIADAELTKVQLYRQDRARPETGVDQISQTDTLKFDLSVDAATETAAYVSVNAEAEMSVVVVGPNTDGEKNLGEGRHPTLLPGAFFVVFERGDKIISVNTQTGDEYELLTLPSAAPMAVDSDRMLVAFYEPTTKSVQEYSVAGMTGASYLSSTPVEKTPQELVYINGKLVQLSREGSMITLVSPSTLVTLEAPVLSGRLSNLKLATYHD